MRLGVIGCGNMASAIVKGAFAARREGDAFTGFDLDPEKVKALGACGLVPADSIAGVLKTSEYVLLAVKPQNMEEVLAEIAASPDKDRIYLSIAAGVTADYVKKALGFDARVVPIMPNTPLLLGLGAVAMARVAPVSEAEFEAAKALFTCAGVVCPVAPEQMNAIIAINGSSPAFIYEFAKGFLSYAQSQGIGYETALTLFAQSLRGAAEMMERSGQDLDTLIQTVSSKGGTTIAGLEAFRAAGFNEAIQAGCEACTRRAGELAR